MVVYLSVANGSHTTGLGRVWSKQAVKLPQVVAGVMGSRYLTWGIVKFDFLWASFDDNMICHIDGVVQERHNSSALAIELHPSCTNPLICINTAPLWSPAPIYIHDNI